jgi:hypothetical protein
MTRGENKIIIDKLGLFAIIQNKLTVTTIKL